MSQRAAAFDFRPLAVEDLPLLHRWFNAPHARRSFGDSLEEIEAEYLPQIAGRSPGRSFIVVLDGRAVGHVEWERMGDTPEFQRTYEVDDPDTANCDVILGEPDVAHRGLGAGMIRAFLERIVFKDARIRACVIDPMTDNAIAIRAYEKAGFRFLRALPEDGEGSSVYLMELRREDLARPPRRDEVFLRPAREGELPIAVAIDDDACLLYEEAGIVIDPEVRPSFFEREAEAWGRSLREGNLLFACAPGGEPVGFVALGLVDGRPHLQQVSVLRAWARRGIGRSLVERAQRWSVRAGELWLTTYDHLPYNGPFYERMGFARSPEPACGPELRAILDEERLALPAPEHRIAMCHRHRAPEVR